MKNLYKFLLFSVICQIFLHFVSVLTPFAIFDDYHFLQLDYQGFFKHPQVHTQLSLGRPFAAIVLGVYAQFAKTAASLSFLRVLSLLIFSISQAFFIYLAIHIAKLREKDALVLSVPLFSLAGFISVCFWVTASMFPYALFLSLFAFWVYHRTAGFKERIVIKNYLWPFGILLSSFLFYPSFATPFLWIPLLMFVFPKDQPAKVDAGYFKRLLTFFLATCIAYFVFIKAILFPIAKLIMGKSAASVSPYPFKVQSHPLERIGYFFGDLSTATFNFISVNSPYFVRLITIILLIGLGLKLIQIKKIHKGFFKPLLIFCAFIGLVNIQSLAAQTQTAVARTIVGYAGVIIILVYASLIELKKFLKGRAANVFPELIFLGIAILTLGTGAYSSYTATLNAFLERRHIDTAFRKANLDTLDQVVVLQHPQGETIVSSTENDGYNWITTDKISTMICPMLNDILTLRKADHFYFAKCGYDSVANGRKKIPLDFYLARPGLNLVYLKEEPVYETEKTLWIDSNEWVSKEAYSHSYLTGALLTQDMRASIEDDRFFFSDDGALRLQCEKANCYADFRLNPNPGVGRLDFVIENKNTKANRRPWIVDQASGEYTIRKLDGRKDMVTLFLRAYGENRFRVKLDDKSSVQLLEFKVSDGR